MNVCPSRKQAPPQRNPLVLYQIHVAYLFGHPFFYNPPPIIRFQSFQGVLAEDTNFIAFFWAHFGMDKLINKSLGNNFHFADLYQSHNGFAFKFGDDKNNPWLKLVGVKLNIFNEIKGNICAVLREIDGFPFALESVAINMNAAIAYFGSEDVLEVGADGKADKLIVFLIEMDEIACCFI